MKTVIQASEIFLPGEQLHEGYVQIEDGVTTGIFKEKPEGTVVDATGLWLMPGLIDIHVHGGCGHDTMDVSTQAVQALSLFKIKEGVTTFCPTTVTTSIEKTKAAIEKVREAVDEGVKGAKIAGIFLEGPYISPKYKGAHPEEFIRGISLDELKELVDCGGGTIKSIAIAPEIENAMEAIRYLSARGVGVRIGHSGASLETACEAIANGAGIGIHTYNAMSPLSHREPGMVGAILTNDHIYAEVICDLVHLHPKAIEVVVRCKGTDKVILITDCMMAGGLQDGQYMLGELPVVVEASVARTLEGALAGSTLNLMSAVKHMYETVGVPLEDAVKMATLNPARALGMDDTIGSIAPGKRADFIAVDHQLQIQFVMIDGKRM